MVFCFLGVLKVLRWDCTDGERRLRGGFKYDNGEPLP